MCLLACSGWVAGSWLFPAAIVTIAIGAVGVLGARRLMPLIAFSVVGSMGTLMIAISAFTPEATTAALYYLVHSTFAAAALFLIADLVVGYPLPRPHRLMCHSLQSLCPLTSRLGLTLTWPSLTTLESKILQTVGINHFLM